MTEQKIEQLIAKMSVREKLGQLNQLETVRADKAEELKDKIRRGEVGSLLMSVGATAGNTPQGDINTDFYDELQRIAVEQSPSGIPLILGRDVIHGHKTVFPIPLAMSASFDPALVKVAYRDTAREAANDGIHWSFAPMLDISRDPRWGRCIESPGEDPYLGAQMAKAVVEGFQGDDLAAPDSLAACAKHFIGYGAAEGGRDYHHTEITDNSLRNYYLSAFRAAVDAGVQTVMNSFNEIGGQPTVSSRYLMTDILRGELGFDGFVVADYGAVVQQVAEGAAEDEESAAAMALYAGTDMDMVDEVYLRHMEKCLDEGSVSMETLDEAVRRILKVKMRLGLFDSPYTKKQEIDKLKHDADARALAAECAVLLKNQNDTLPLRKNARVAMVGPFINEKTSMLGSWALDGRAENVVSLIEGMKSVGKGGRIFGTESALYDDQLMYARTCDILLLALGESRRVTGENCCMASIDIGEEYVDIARRAKSMGKPVVAVLCYGRPIAIEKLEPYCDAILWCWHPGTQAGNAIADVLYGEVDASGRLPMTLPKYTGQIPLYYNVLPSTHDVNGYYAEKYCYRDRSCMPMYPFGYGLSYTSFNISPVSLSADTLSLEALEKGASLTASVTVRNAGNRTGTAVPQLYIRDVAAKMARPLRELKGFRRLTLAPGEEATVTFEIGFDRLAYYLGSQKLVEKGSFELFVGENSHTENAIGFKIV